MPRIRWKICKLQYIPWELFIFSVFFFLILTDSIIKQAGGVEDQLA